MAPPPSWPFETFLGVAITDDLIDCFLLFEGMSSQGEVFFCISDTCVITQMTHIVCDDKHIIRIGKSTRSCANF